MGWMHRICHAHLEFLGDILSLNYKTNIFGLFIKTQEVGHMTKINKVLLCYTKHQCT
jgi:hypothetical protein